MLIASFLFSSCYSYKPMMSKKDANAGNVLEMAAKVTPGKSYRLKLRTGNYLYMKAIRVEEGNILGKNYVLVDDHAHRLYKGDSIRVNQKDIVDIKKMKFSAERTTRAVIIPVLVVVAIARFTYPYYFH